MRSEPMATIMGVEGRPPSNVVTFGPRFRWETVAEEWDGEDAPEAHPLADYASFAVKLRINPSNGEAREFRRAMATITEATNQIRALYAAGKHEEADALGDPDDDFYALCAPYVVAWNAADAEGQIIPPPAEAGGEAFWLVPVPISTWITTRVTVSTRGGRRRKALSPPSGPMPEVSGDARNGSAPDSPPVPASNGSHPSSSTP